VVIRDDDTTESLSQRLDLDESQTAPLLEFYGREARLGVLDGSKGPDEVFGLLTAAIDFARKSD
ncbi:MAG: hypothetical protein RL688_919, partial [Actinomycetota bacterium]